MSEREFAIGLIGVTGYTGRLAAEFAYSLNEKLVTRGEAPLTFLFIGRRLEALQSQVEALNRKMSPELSSRWSGAGVSCVEDMTNQPDKLDQEIGRCQALVTYAGPYTQCGEPVVASCLRCSTHYVDITAEVIWVKMMELKYGRKAEQEKIKVIPCCGFDFLPNDLMMLQLAMVAESDKCVQSWGGLKTLREVTHAFSQSTPMVSGGTAISGIGMLRSLGFYRALLWYLNPYALCNVSPVDSTSLVATVSHPSVRFAPKPMMVGTNAWNDEYCVKFVMSYLMSKFINWSNEVQNFKYGSNLRYFGGEVRKNVLWAYLWSSMIWIGYFGASLLALLPSSITSKIVPKPGCGPAIDPKTAYLYSHLRADFPSGSVHLKWRLLGGESYVFAARASLLAAMLIVRKPSSLPDRYGVLPASAAVGEPLLGALAQDMGLEMTAPEIKSL